MCFGAGIETWYCEPNISKEETAAPQLQQNHKIVWDSQCYSSIIYILV